jgi:hypothetical protein
MLAIGNCSAAGWQNNICKITGNKEEVKRESGQKNVFNKKTPAGFPCRGFTLSTLLLLF